MQKLQLIKIIQKPPKCIFNNSSYEVCINSQCCTSPFICIVQQCPCKQIHINKHCLLKKWSELVQDLIKSQRPISLDLINRLQDIQRIIKEQKRFLQLQYNKFLSFKNSSGMNENARDFILKINIGDYDTLNGMYIAKMYHNLNRSPVNIFAKSYLEMNEEVIELQKINQKFLTVLNSLYHQSTPSQNQFYWSLKMKSPTIKIQDMKAIQTKKITAKNHSDQKNVFILMEPQLKKIHIFGFRILKGQGEIYVGVAIKDILDRENFSFKKYSIGDHGVYLFGTKGMSYSHHNELQNYKKYIDNFELRTNDNIYVHVNLQQNYVSFFKNNKSSKKIAELKLDKKNKDSNYYACVYLGEQTSIEIINEKYIKHIDIGDTL